jgi:hypothetical protein
MMVDYAAAQALFVDESRVFIDALSGLAGDQLSIVIHKTGGTPSLASLANYFQTGAAMASTHFGIDLDGTIGQFVLLKDGAGGNCCLEAGHDTYWDSYAARYGNLNLCTISIEHVDVTLDNSTTPPQAQLDASFALVKWLVNRFSIPLDHIKTHASLDPIDRARCPGNYPMAALIAYLRSNILSINQQQSIHDRWIGFFSTLRIATGNVTIPLAPTGTGIYNAWQSLYLAGKQLGPATSYEYDSIDWGGNPIKCQDFGSCRIEYYYTTGVWHAYGPSGQIA